MEGMYVAFHYTFETQYTLQSEPAMLNADHLLLLFIQFT